LEGDGVDWHILESRQQVRIHAGSVIAPTRILDLLRMDFGPLFDDLAKFRAFILRFCDGELAI
jgi:hypothetical protein